LKSSNVHLFPFGIGNDVNTHLLDQIANETNSFSQYVGEKEDLELKLSSFYGKIKTPALVNVRLGLAKLLNDSDVQLKQVYPEEMPDVFVGQTLLIFGRYSGSGKARVDVTGTCEGDDAIYSADADFPKSSETHEFIARLWATRRIGFLLDKIRLHGESKELKDEVISLARQHGVVTPYTAYLIIEDEQKRGVPVASRTLRDIETDPRAQSAVKNYYNWNLAGSKELQKVGQQAVASAQNMQRLKDCNNTAGAMQADGLDRPAAAAGPVLGSVATTQPIAGYRAANNYTQQVRVLNRKTFYQNGNIWTDAESQQKQNLTRCEVKFNSQDYYALLNDHREIAQWLSLGNEIDVVVGETVYVIR
jgi:Ca-activated chloride channel family protein